jgi:dUTP pyrophosphatase
MDMSSFRKSVGDLAKSVTDLVEEKLGDRSQIEDQLRSVAKQAEKLVSDTIRSKAGAASVTIKFKKLGHFIGDLPAYATRGASGLDVRARIESPISLQSLERILIPTGLSVEIPEGYEIQVRPRSGLAIKQGLSLVNTPGTIDADYRGELKIIVINLGQETITINDQDRIAQLVVCPVVLAQIEEATDLSTTDRNQGGFGSTGIQ